jgi:hypothetical protein
MRHMVFCHGEYADKNAQQTPEAGIFVSAIKEKDGGVTWI